MDHQTLQISIKPVSNKITDEDLSLLVSCAVSRDLKMGQTLLREGEL